MIAHFLHIGKTGGTALVHALRRSGCSSMSPSQARRGLPDIYELGLGTGSGPLTVYVHPHYEGLREVPEGEKAFFLLRDPIGRCVSGFCSRQRQGWPRYRSPWSPGEKVAFERFPTINALATALSSTNAEERTVACGAMKDIQHVGDSYWQWFETEEYFRSRLADIFFVGFQEHLSDDFEILKERLRLPRDLDLPTDGTLAFKGPTDVDRTLDERARDNLRHWYRDEYRFVALCKDVLGPEVLAVR